MATTIGLAARGAKVSLDEYSDLVAKQLGNVSGKALTSLTPPALHRALSGSGSATCEIGPGQGQHFLPRRIGEEELATAPAELAQTFPAAKPIFAVQRPSGWRRDVLRAGLRAMDPHPAIVYVAGQPGGLRLPGCSICARPCDTRQESVAFCLRW